jgi:hypothetical protein
MSLLIFTIYLGLWPMHVFRVMDVLQYVEVPPRNLSFIQELQRVGYWCDISWTCKLACNSWFDLLTTMLSTVTTHHTCACDFFFLEIFDLSVGII